MNETLLAVVVGSTVVTASFVFLLNRLSRFIHPMRLELAERGEALIASGQLSPRVMRRIEWMLDNAFNPNVMWSLSFYSLGMIPRLALFPSYRIQRQRDIYVGPELRSDVDKINSLFLVSAMAAAPIGALVFLAIFFVLTVTMAMFGRTVNAMRQALAILIGADAEGGCRSAS